MLVRMPPDSYPSGEREHRITGTFGSAFGAAAGLMMGSFAAFVVIVLCLLGALVVFFFLHALANGPAR